MAEDLQRTTVSKEELEVLAGRLMSAQEDERTRIARELHDDLSQRLAAAAIELGRLQRVAPELGRIKEHIAQLSEDVHGLSRRLHTSTLDDIGLVAAVEAECRSFFERGGPPVEFTAEGDFDALRRDVQLALYRIVQEALRNIQRHSGASDVNVQLRRTADSVELEIRDNGRGFDLGDRSWRRGVGLASMEERANLLGGHCTIESKPGAGTQITATVPIADNDAKTESSAG
jgi:signal transduction histidine kinase